MPIPPAKAMDDSSDVPHIPAPGLQGQRVRIRESRRGGYKRALVKGTYWAAAFCGIQLYLD